MSTHPVTSAARPGPEPRPGETRRRARSPRSRLAGTFYAAVPLSVELRLAVLRGTLWYLRRSDFRRHLLEVLGRYFGERAPGARRGIARHYFQSRAKLRFHFVRQEFWDSAGAASVPIDGLEHLDEALERGRGVILASAHFGYPMMIKPLFEPRGRSVLVMASDTTRRQGAHGRDLSPDFNLRPLLGALERNEIVFILVDGRSSQAFERIPVAGVDIDFAPGVLSVARATGAAVLPTFVVDDPGSSRAGGLRVVLHGPLEIQVTSDRQADHEDNLRRFASAYEQQVRTHPHNFHWRWVRDGVFLQPSY